MFTVSANAASDVELGLDWTAFLRDSLIGLGYRVDSTFDAWRFLTMSTHPLSTPSSTVPQISSRSYLGTVPPTARNIGEGSCIPRHLSGNAASINSDNNSENYSETPNLSVPVRTRLDTFSAFIPYTPSASSSNSQPVHVPINATPSDDILEVLLLSPIVSRNIFTAEPSELVKIVKSHHIPITPNLTVRGARHAIISHLITAFVRKTQMPGTLLSLAHAHGLEVSGDANLNTLRDSIATHIGMGHCTSREALSSLACSSISSQTESQITSSSEDPSTRLQMHIIRQIAPILPVRPLKRLLDMHDIRYASTDKIRKLRNRLDSFLDRLDRGKHNNDEPTVMGSARHARRTEINRLRAEWPQVIPDRLKWRLIRDFNLQISAENLATFACGSCNELCPIADKKTIGLDQFDIDLLKRPDYNDPDSDDSEMEVDSEDDSSQPELRPKIKPWLNRQYPEPPMPMDSTPYSSLLIEPDALDCNPSTFV
ncbi:hypothetical protein B0H13DRAFT_1873046 [Mycena leptocephala]|nr:hypothetical protein B0H13DRAFT_1873046 [Mycena leptocephala]